MSRFAPINQCSIFVATVAMLLCISVHDASALGTTAGEIIANTAHITYDMNGKSLSLQSNVSKFMVDDKVSFTLTVANAANVPITPGGLAYMTYILTNNGNAPHDFTLDAAVSGAQTFTPDTSPLFYRDQAGADPLKLDSNAGNLPFISALPPDKSVTLYHYISAPKSNAVDGQSINYLVTAEAYQADHLGKVNPPLKSAIQATTDAAISKNANLLTRHVVLADGHGNGNDRDRDGKYAVVAVDGYNSQIGFRIQSATINIEKSVTVTDRFGNRWSDNEAPLHSTLHYTLLVTAAGNGTAMGVVITDPIPANTSYAPGTLKLNGSPLSDAADGDAGDVGGTSPGLITVRLNDMTSATPAQLITFDVKVN